ncbi:VOC family protein [Agarivorans sp.]|uniref:VOC family protein n=1 Tax=Agarivorans sp. TaxID=1872412 RepID=UPI003CFF0B53
MNQHQTLNYVEYPSGDLNATKQFFTQVFAWQFEDFGEAYTAFSEPNLAGGFYLAALHSDSRQGAALLMFYSDDLEQTQANILAAGGTISKAIFHFPGGRRFHFCEPSGNEFAVWSAHG